MRSFVQWLDDEGFYVRETWNAELGRMVGEGYLKLFPIQRDILGFCLTPDEDGLLPYTTVLFSTIKKSGKTAIAAAVVAWYAAEAPAGSEIYIIANSLEHAEGRVMRDVRFHYEHKNRGLLKRRQAKVVNYLITMPNGTFIQSLAQNYRTAAGSRHGLTVWDELWGAVDEYDRRLWEELTPISTVTNSLRFVVTYAGFENQSELLWDLYLAGVGPDEHEKGQGKLIPELKQYPCWTSGRMFTYWNHEPTMPWQTEVYMDEQMKTLRPSAFLRLHMNRWVTTHEEFIPIEWFDQAARIYEASADIWEYHPMRTYPLYVAVDAAPKHDHTAVVAVGYDSGRAKIGIAWHRIWTPKEGEWFDFDATVGSYLMEMSKKFRLAAIVYDPTQLHQTMNKLRQQGLPVIEFPQTITNMTAASQSLYDVMKNRNLEAYPDDELRRHIQMASADVNNRGFRITKPKGYVGERQHVDAAVCLAMATYEAISSGGVDISVPIRIVSPFADMLPESYIDPEQANIPFALRD